MRRIIGILILMCAVHLSAQIFEPVTWNFEHERVSDTQGRIVATAEIEDGWHVYGLQLPEGGPQSTTLVFEVVKNAELVGEVRAEGLLVEKYDATFDMDLNWYEMGVTLVQDVTYDDADAVYVEGAVKFMACDHATCLPPTEELFVLGGAAVAADVVAPSVVPMVPLEVAMVTTPVGAAEVNDLWAPVHDELSALGDTGTDAGSSLWWIFLAGLLGGFVALFTPCVWPIIPMTVSFFLKRADDKVRGRRDAVFYGLSIVVIYVVLGILITLIFGASALNSLATNAFFNIFFFGLLVLFAVSFFGAFELTLPASWTTKLDAKAESTSGVLSILLMAFTLVLVSFSCTGPIIGTLLVEVANSGTIVAPAVGMLGFALALALPFSLFAFFPAMLKSMPRSGGWLNSVKVVLGFLELALALKFLSVADLAYGWGILDREVFVALWIVIFALLGVYLLGKLRLSHDSPVQYVSVPRLLMAIASFSFAVYMVPGLWGAPLKAISAFAPPLTTQDFSLYDNEVHADFTDYEAGMAYAQQAGKPVVLDFSGYGCVNCRKMEASVWTDDRVATRLNDDFVLITLYVDDKTPLVEPYEVEENGKTRRIRTLGDKWSYLQRVKFNTNAQPFYVMLDAAGRPMAGSYSFDEDPNNFLVWLDAK